MADCTDFSHLRDHACLQSAITPGGLSRALSPFWHPGVFM